jgi:polyhydroxyalkanoate depolymerase
MATLILYPDLGRTFGSAGSPMDTEGEKGYLTEFSRMVGEEFIDRIIEISGRTVSEGHPGAKRKYYDGRLQISGFYFLGTDQHIKNFLQLLDDLKQGNRGAVERQKVFYRWYNTVNHSPVEFIRDTYKKIFVRNALVRETLEIDGKRISIKDYPKSVPIWALGGTRDDITPPKQATGHMQLIRPIPKKAKLTIICEAGHMGLFRSRKILDKHYKKIVDFLLAHSDRNF